MSESLDTKNSQVAGQVNSLQLNIVTVIDVAKVNRTQTLNGNVYLSDNSPESKNKGTQNLETVCTQGQVINWLIYPMDLTQKLDGSWPPMAKINNIVFINEDGSVHNFQVCENLEIYGGIDKARPNNLTPVYHYWAGTVIPDLPLGKYRYRFVIEMDTTASEQLKYHNVETMSLQVVALKSPEKSES